MWRQLLVATVLAAAGHVVTGEKRTMECPAVCEPDKCPNIGPIKLSDCPTPYIKTDRCGCCKRCEIVHVTTTVSPSKRDEVCEKVVCPKKKLCMLNMQGIPVCKCPSLDLCKDAAERKRNKVCGSDGITYPSRCHVKVASCQADKKIRAVSRGKCPGTEPTSKETSVLDTAEMAIDVTIDGLRQTQTDNVGEEAGVDGIRQEVSELVSSRREEGRRGRRKDKKRERKRLTNRRNRKKNKQNRQQKKMKKMDSLPL